ncbi:MAG: hypothetical protein QXH26_03370 [Candidatus Hadarchaeales archaeon]
MVLVAKVFELKEKLDFPTMARKLKDFSEEEPYREDKKLLTDILDLKLDQDRLFGVFTKDYVLSKFYRRGAVETLVTEEVPFWIKRFGKRLFLLPLAPSKPRGVKKLLTDYVANKLSEILFIKPGSIVETYIPHQTLQRLHESNPHATKLIWFDQVDIPGVKKLALAGTGLADTSLYREYLKHGKLWYIVFEVLKKGLVVGITRNSVITLFSRSSVEDFVGFIFEEVFPLIAESEAG